MRVIKVLNVIDSLGAGGAESLLKNFSICAKRNRDFQVDLCMLYSKNIFKDELDLSGLNVYELGFRFKYDFCKITRIVRLISSNNYDVVHAHLFPADLVCAIASVFVNKRIRFIFSEHSIYNRRRSVRIYRPVDRFVYSRYTRVICVSDVVKRKLNEYIPETAEKSVVIKNAVPIKLVNESREKKYDILFVGRLEYVKGADILINAVKIYRDRKHRLLKVAIVGDGSKKKALLRMARESGLENDVIFLGVREDVAQLMWQSRVFVLPSRWEGLPIAILEAMANKTPVITAPVGGTIELIENYRTGLFFEPENAESLSEMIDLLLSDTNLQAKIKENAFRKVLDEYSIEAYTEKMLDLYKETASK